MSCDQLFRKCLIKVSQQPVDQSLPRNDDSSVLKRELEIGKAF